MKANAWIPGQAGNDVEQALYDIEQALNDIPQAGNDIERVGCQCASSSRWRLSVSHRPLKASHSISTRYTERCCPPVQPIATVT